MNEFKSLFGVTENQIKSTCILFPFLTKNLIKSFGIKELNKGYLYKCGEAKNVTLIHTGVGAAFVGDAVLYLKDTPCKNIFFLGSCGLIESSEKLNIGSLVMPSSCLAIESFTHILNKDFSNITVNFADKQLLKMLKGEKIFEVICASFGSLKLEETSLPFFKKNNIQTIDIETSAFFAAASKIKKRALALLYVTDIIKEKPFYRQQSADDKKAIQNAINQAINILTICSKDLDQDSCSEPSLK